MNGMSEMEQLVKDIPIFDGHDHTMPETKRLAQAPLDPFAYLLRLLSADMWTSGATWEEISFIRNSEISLEDRIPLFLQWWEPVRTTSYGRALHLVIRHLFDLDDITDTNSILTLAAKLQETQRPGWYRYVFEQAGIERAVLDRTRPDLEGLASLINIDRELFLPVVRYDPFICVTNRASLLPLEELTSIRIRRLDDLEAALVQMFEKHYSEGMVAIKTALAYDRTLEIEPTSRHDAESIFNQIFVGLGEGPSWKEAKPLQDYLLHCVIRLAVNHKLPVQIHTGAHYPEVKGHGNRLPNANPSLLLNLILHYPEVSFVIFHAGVPYVDEFTLLAKHHRNVYADLSWLHIISPTLARRTLHQLIEAVPANKVIGFGGDYLFVEGTYAHAIMARQALVRVLAEKMSEGYLRLEEAEYIATRYLYANGVALYQESQN